MSKQIEMIQQRSLDLRIERNALHIKLREANNQIAHLEFELKSLKSRITSANALAEKAEQLLEFARERIATADDLHEVFELFAALRKYEKASNG